MDKKSHAKKMKNKGEALLKFVNIIGGSVKVIQSITKFIV